MGQYYALLKEVLRAAIEIEDLLLIFYCLVAIPLESEGHRHRSLG
jgi:hypothetical protein